MFAYCSMHCDERVVHTLQCQILVEDGVSNLGQVKRC